MVNSGFNSDLKEIGNLDQVIHTPARLMTIMLLHQARTMDFIQLMNCTQLTWGNLSTHLSKLEEKGYVMITKTFKGKRPHTLVTLTDSGRQAYLQWGQIIIKALPESTAKRLLDKSSEQQWEQQTKFGLSENSGLPQVAGRDVFFLPRYHRWGMEIPPVKEFNPLA